MTLTYFCDLDTHLNNGLRPPSACTAVVCLPTTAAFLVVCLSGQKHLRLQASCIISTRSNVICDNALWCKVSHSVEIADQIRGR